MVMDLQDADTVVATLERAATILLDDANRVGCSVRLPARGRLLATGDLHDNPIHLAKVMALAGLDAADDRHVVLHELVHGERLINGMDFSYRMLVRVAAFVERWPGRVHPMLANHELAQLTRTGVSKGAGNSVELFAEAVGYVFTDDEDRVTAAMDSFIRAMPLAVRSEGGVLCAHSLPAARVMDRFDPDILDRALTDDDYVRSTGSAYLMVWGRGYTDEQVETLADRWDVRLFCLGHEHTDLGLEMRGPRVVIINTDHEHAAVLPIDLAAPPSAEEALYAVIPLASVPEPS